MTVIGLTRAAPPGLTSAAATNMRGVAALVEIYPPFLELFRTNEERPAPLLGAR